MGTFIRRVVVSIAKFIQSAWIIIGISLAMLLLMEACYRIQRGARSGGDDAKATASPATRDPQASAPWFDQFTREYDATRPQRWKSYVYFGRRPNFHGTYVNIDSVGHRITPQPSTPAVPALRVFFFGGSTMWGTAQRDDHTIAAEASRRLQTLAGPGARIEVTNFGESGYVMTQEMIELMLALRAGNRPDVVVFYDGINDVGTTVQYGVAGIPQNESKRVAEFEMGRALDRTGFARGLGKDMRALGILTGQAFNQSELLEWVKSLKHAPAPSYPRADSATRSLLRIHTENVRIVESLSQAYGFVPIYVWQPSVHSTQKHLTPFEARIRRGIANDAFQSRLRDVQVAIAPLLDSAMATIAPGRFIDADTLFRNDSLPVFVDRIGHNTEVSIPRIVDAFWPALEAAVARQRARGTTPVPAALP